MSYWGYSTTGIAAIGGNDYGRGEELEAYGHGVVAHAACLACICLCLELVLEALTGRRMSAAWCWPQCGCVWCVCACMR